MSDHKPDGPYVYQPFGMKEREHWAAKRIFAVGGMDRLATVRGLTKDEATRIVAALRQPPASGEGTNAPPEGGEEAK